ncbi:hypothetical protein EPI10_031055 [Gossypium australe]|uniref:Uncharacterized protein n=1 Tax=Gossypium australe TaxID=47621 RepID=A0A5B6X0K7_9ROSI|nr:hypothetical protein EPI10_031055 [Gossypium australe]
MLDPKLNKYCLVIQQQASSYPKYSWDGHTLCKKENWSLGTLFNQGPFLYACNPTSTSILNLLEGTHQAHQAMGSRMPSLPMM